MRSFVALPVVLLAMSASASPVITIPLTKLQRTGAHLNETPDTDHPRAAILESRQANGSTTVQATNLGYLWYTVSVGIGKPPTYYNLVVDLRSSYMFLG